MTRERVPKSILNTWRPSVSSNQDSKSIENSDTGDSTSDSDTKRSLPFPLSQHRHQRDGSEDEVEQDVISISDMPTDGISLYFILIFF